MHHSDKSHDDEEELDSNDEQRLLEEEDQEEYVGNDIIPTASTSNATKDVNVISYANTSQVLQTVNIEEVVITATNNNQQCDANKSEGKRSLKKSKIF